MLSPTKFTQFVFFSILVTTMTASAPRNSAAAKPGPLGLGIVLGDPSGISMKLSLDNQHALQLHAGFEVEKFDRARVSTALDYLFYFRDLTVVAKHKNEIKVNLNPYAGVGTSIQISEGSTPIRLGARAPLGLAFLFAPGNVELFTEIALGIHIFPSTTALIDGGIGARWFF